MKKGFTLIELLAVIVVIAVLALIAIPVVNSVIENSRVGTFRDSALGIKNACMQKYIEYAGSEMVVNVPDNNILINGVFVDKKIEYKGVKPKGGYIIINSKGHTILAIYNDTYCAYKNEDDEDVTVKKISNSSECIANMSN